MLCHNDAIMIDLKKYIKEVDSPSCFPVCVIKNRQMPYQPKQKTLNQSYECTQYYAITLHYICLLGEKSEQQSLCDTVPLPHPLIPVRGRSPVKSAQLCSWGVCTGPVGKDIHREKSHLTIWQHHVSLIHGQLGYRIDFPCMDRQCLHW